MKHDDTTDVGRFVRFHDLAVRSDRGEWIVGRIDTGTFVAMPDEGKLAIELLRHGLSTEQARTRLLAETGQDTDVESFVNSLTELGFVDIGNDVLTAAQRSNWFPGITPRHVGWLLAPALWAALGLWNIFGAGVLLVNLDRLPYPSDLFAVKQGSLILFTQLAVVWLSILLHELAHLLSARACNVPGHIRLGTRLQFLVVETDVSGIWHAARHQRIAVYLSGIVVNLSLATAGLVAAVYGSGGLSFVGTAIYLAQLMLVVPQFFAFMRTDIYFLVQDLFGCRNLFGDAKAYLRFLAARIRNRTVPDPSLALTARERRVVRAYSLVVSLGSVICVGVALLITLPLTIRLFMRAASSLSLSASFSTIIDSIVVLGAILAGQALWITAFWRRKRHTITTWAKGVFGAS